MNEEDFISALRGLASHPGARGLLDDAAVLEFGSETLVLTHDMIVEGVHFLPGDPAEDVAWKLVAVNMSDLAAKGAEPVGVLLGFTLKPEAGWDEAFARGLSEALRAFGAALLGGDTVAAPPGAPRALGVTAVGRATGPVPSRTGAQADDVLWASGSIGDAGAGLRSAIGELPPADELIRRYRRPEPRLALGRALAPLVTAMMDVSDGLLIDAARMAHASDLAVQVDLGEIPLSEVLVSVVGDERESRIDAAIAGDDYELLFAAPLEASAAIERLQVSLGVPLTRIGRFSGGSGLMLSYRGADVPLPPRLGFEHVP